jgi:hypothetical protein
VLLIEPGKPAPAGADESKLPSASYEGKEISIRL